MRDERGEGEGGRKWRRRGEEKGDRARDMRGGGERGRKCRRGGSEEGIGRGTSERKGRKWRMRAGMEKGIG